MFFQFSKNVEKVLIKKKMVGSLLYLSLVGVKADETQQDKDEKQLKA